jgi:hypothetical protein
MTCRLASYHPCFAARLGGVSGGKADAVYADAYWFPPGKACSSAAQLAQSGMALVCLANEPDWVQAAGAQAVRNPESRRIDLEIARNFLGIPGVPQRYVIFIIPPPQ